MATLVREAPDREAVEIYYEEHGRGPAILLTHGYSATSQMWLGQYQALSDAYRVIGWDLRGHGRSASPEPLEAYSEAEAIADMVAILDACGVERAVVGGLSLGGYLSLGFHRAHPERVRALMLLDTGPGYRNAEAREGWNRMAMERADELERRGLDALGNGAEVRIAQHRSAAGLARAARGTLRQFDARAIEHLPKVDVPTLVLAGEKDTPFLAATDYMAAKIPGARKLILQGAGHASNIDRPAEFNAAVRAFLRSLPDA